jgi:hypothetical protein
VFLDEMNRVIPWAELVALIAPFAPSTSDQGGRPPFAVRTTLRSPFLQQWFGLSNPERHQTKIKHPFRVLKCQFGFTRVRYKGLAENTAQLVMLSALSILWVAGRALLQKARG